MIRFGGTSGEFARAMVGILAGRILAKTPMARTKEPGLPSKRVLSIYRTQIRWAKWTYDIVAISGQWLDIAGYQDCRHDLWLTNCGFWYDKRHYLFWIAKQCQECFRRARGTRGKMQMYSLLRQPRNCRYVQKCRFMRCKLFMISITKCPLSQKVTKT